MDDDRSGYEHLDDMAIGDLVLRADGVGGVKMKTEVNLVNQTKKAPKVKRKCQEYT